MAYQYVSDKYEQKDFISKDKILSYVTEEQVFELVFGYQPIELEYVVSPFRDDTQPSCYFERLGQNRLRFIDHARNFFPDCFDAVRVYFGLSSFYDALKFVYERLIEGKDLPKLKNIPITREDKGREPVVIQPKVRWFTSNDAKYWQPYGISKQNLMDDNVFAISHVNMLNTRGGDISYDINELCYVYTGFDSGRKKLYFPTRNENKFISTCTPDDIGCLNSLPLFGRQLIITKSYKDCRVIRNTGRNCIWFQNEGVIPSKELLQSILKRFKDVIVLYDNDEAGITAAKKVNAFIAELIIRKPRALWLPENLREEEIVDPADLVHKESYGELNSFFNSYMI